METSIAGMLILGVLMVVVVLMSRAFVVSNTVLGTALVESADLAGERARTQLTFETSTSDGTNLVVKVRNSGGTSISAYEDIDLIVEYAPESGDTVYQRLTYVNGGPPGSGQWTSSTLTPDTLQPGIWDPGETMALEAKLRSVQQNATTGFVTVASPNGVAVSGTFTR